MSTHQAKDFKMTPSTYSDLGNLGQPSCCGQAACSCMQLNLTNYDSSMVKNFGMNSLQIAMAKNAKNPLREGYRAVNRGSRGGHGTVYAHYA